MEQFFRPPERERMREEPIVRFSRTESVIDPKTKKERSVKKEYVAVCGVELPVYDGPDGSVFTDDEFADFALDEMSLDLLKRCALSVKLDQPLLLEGETDIGKSKTIEYLAHLTNHRLFRLSLSGQTDVSEFIGKYVPNTDDARATFDRVLRNRSDLSEETRKIIEEAEAEGRSLTEAESRDIAGREGLAFGANVQWVWQDGLAIKAMTHAKGRGAWLYFDELGTAEPQILIKVNRIFETNRRIEITENGNRMVEGGPEFRIFGSTNPPEYAGGTPFRPDFLRRWVYQKIGSLSVEVVKSRLGFLFRQESGDAQTLLEKSSVVDTTPLDFKTHPEVSKIVEAFLVDYFEQMRKAVAEGKLGRDQRQQFRYDFTDLIRVRDYLSAFGGENIQQAMKEAIEFYFKNKLGTEKDRKEADRIYKTIFEAKKFAEKFEALEQKLEAGAEPEEESKELKSARLEAEGLLAKLENKPKKRRRVESGELHERISILASNLSLFLSSRFSSFGKSESFTISTPELPPGLTQEHLDTINEVLGGKLEERILPTLEDLHDLDESYVDVMYPVTQLEDDKAKGLVSFRPSWWNNSISISGHTFTDHPTCGETYLHSMRHQLGQIGGSLVLLDTATKPEYIDGTQGYGTVEGVNKTADPLLPLFQEAFGPSASRFNHSYKDIQEKLLPLAKKRIADTLKEKGLPDVSFDVILVPATLENIDLTFHHPKSSTTDTSEWTSTVLIDDEGVGAGRALLAGRSGYGGAAVVRGHGVADSNGNWGARLAVVLNATEH